ncbi:MAG TPA: hypothetical protein PKD53_13660 [Chloroflexaceae bacterium]|nr:hypothetical protein [Chloroflexaceae bacterium]
MAKRRPDAPEGNSSAYMAIIGTSALLCFAWLLTGSLMLTLFIIALGLLHLARHFPEAEAFVAADPVLVWLRRASPLIIIGIATLVLAVRYLR